MKKKVKLDDANNALWDTEAGTIEVVNTRALDEEIALLKKVIADLEAVKGNKNKLAEWALQYYDDLSGLAQTKKRLAKLETKQ